MVVKFLRTRLYENHGLFAASAADLVKEGNILSSLSHTNVIRLHAVSSLYGVDAYASGYHDAFFLVLERLECTLSDRINEWHGNNNNSNSNNSNNKIALAKSELLSERVDVTLQLADALAYLHKNHVIHRDLKPDNIGFGADGVLKVFDFDIARVNKTENELFHMTQKVGSPRYMSPECARREPYNLKADVYSYALLTHQILTLQKPYDDISDAEHDELVFYRGIRPHVPVGLPSGTQNLLGSAWSDTVSKRPTMEVVRSVLAEQRSEILRMGTLERTAPSVPVANTTAYVWSCSFAAVSDNNEMLRRI
eukprot:jgi/Psemu1/247007/estExt_Genewise1.C_9250011